MLHVPVATLRRRLLHHHNVNYDDFAQVQTYEPYGPVILATDLTPVQTARLAESQSDLPGVDMEEQPVRNYPYGKHRARTCSGTSASSTRTSTRRASATATRRTT